MTRKTENRVENLIRQWIIMQEQQHEHIAVLKDEQDLLTEVIVLPTGDAITRLKHAS